MFKKKKIKEEAFDRLDWVILIDIGTDKTKSSDPDSILGHWIVIFFRFNLRYVYNFVQVK